MNEEQLINKIKQLKTIAPNNDWVLANKTDLLGKERSFDWGFAFKPALVGVSLFAVVAAFNLSQNSLPGEWLFTLKKITEKGNIAFSSNDKKTIANFEIANERLKELTLITKNNDVRKIAPAINEFQSTIKDVTKEISKVYVTDKKVNDGLIKEADSLEKTKEVVGQTLASEFGGQAYDEYRVAMARVRIKAAKDLIKKLRLVDLSAEDNLKLDQMNDDLDTAKTNLENKEYNSAFKIISEILESISRIGKEKQIQ